MLNTPMTIKVPGKLMIAGEFAVLEPHHNLVVMAVDRFVYATLQQSSENGLSLQDFKLHDLNWEYIDNNVKVFSDDTRIRFVEDSMAIAMNYLREKDITPTPFRLSIKSELDDASGVKYGLGSSAAVVTSVITAILKKFLNNDPTAALVFKLAAISHVKTQGNGSGADVAASSYGGFLQYSSFQAEWLRDAYYNTNTLLELLEKDWTYFSVQPLELPDNVYVCIGWTGKPASTKKLVNEILKLKLDNPAQFQQFLTSSDIAVAKFIQGMKEQNTPVLLEGVKENRRALATVGNNANVEIETPLLTKLCDLAEQYGGAGKPSGAGGGDCGIAFMPSKQEANDLMQAWEQAGIKPLTLKVNPHGASIVQDEKDIKN
ncbi:phosphomevalonate kinase [Virgibacillus profundi]|uniref:phosphomevalonate kinase n=1 Tax=Virgibacillus profundi TaxID=2024555 RepID=A0A2A2IA31_9BACI|nr:phosphomevalonate kinase [Virgibacillus profundi]PAV28186.1 phosphomevalonate kinase [Virgibacillus profundi]PXY52491.1 phosphomevalonate kinase [Virgibacillus profundi]